MCEALVRHPDFLFTMPPSVEKRTTAAEKDPLRLVALTQRALGRPPTAAEFTKLGTDGLPAMIDAVFATPTSARTTSTAFSCASRARARPSLTSRRGCGPTSP